MAKKFTKLFLGDVVHTIGSKVFRKLTIESGGLPIWNGTDLTGTTWNVPSGWITTSMQAEYNVNFKFTKDGVYKGTCTYLGLGYRSPGIGRANEMGVDGEYPDWGFKNTTSLNFEFTGGTDATNTSLISWLKENGELTSHQMPTPTLISFTVFNRSFHAEEGMTWEQWVASTYNTNGYSIHYDTVCIGSSAYHDYITYGNVRVNPTNTIINGGTYGTEAWSSGGSND